MVTYFLLFTWLRRGLFCWGWWIWFYCCVSSWFGRSGYWESVVYLSCCYFGGFRRGYSLRSFVGSCWSLYLYFVGSFRIYNLWSERYVVKEGVGKVMVGRDLVYFLFLLYRCKVWGLERFSCFVVGESG